jgi:uncharacterized delta-60 repeat protein
MKNYLICVFILFQFVSYSQPGSLDATFGTGGKRYISMGGLPLSDIVTSTTIQSDGKILIGGYAYDLTTYGFALCRLKTDGSLDGSFGVDGKVITSFGNYEDKALGMVIQPDGKIILVGVTYNSTNNDVAMVRYNTNGTLDNSFGVSGKVVTPLGTNNDCGYAVALQTNGKIVVGGSVYNGSNYDFALMRYNSNGFLDNTFGSGGIATTDFGISTDEIYTIAIQNDGKIVAAGYTLQGTFYSIALARYNSNGSLDNSFNGIGKLITTLPYEAQAYTMLTQNDGKILIGGRTWQPESVILIRYSSNGSLDTSFGSGGIVATEIDGVYAWANSIKVQSDDKVLVAACSPSGQFILLRYNSNGTLDSGFDSDGIVMANLSGDYVSSTSVALQNDGKIVLAGNGMFFTIMRFNGGTINIDEQEYNSLISIYPIPAHNSFTISLNGQSSMVYGQLQIFDVMGRIAHEQSLNHKSEIITHKLSPGIYFLQVRAGQKVFTEKLVVE